MTQLSSVSTEEARGPSRLLIAVSTSTDIEAELSWGATFARAMRVPVTLLRLLDPGANRDPAERAAAIAADLLAIAASDERLTGLDVDTQVRVGLPHEELQRVAAETPGAIALLQAGTPGLVRRALLGTDAHAVIRSLRTPFILIPAAPIPAIALQRAVVGDDGSALAERVTAVSSAVAGLLGIELVRVEAIEPGGSDSGDFLHTTTSIEPHLVRVRGRAGETLLAVARARNAALIVVGSHGRGGMTRLFLGSTSEWLVDHADRPIMIVPQGFVDA